MTENQNPTNTPPPPNTPEQSFTKTITKKINSNSKLKNFIQRMILLIAGSFATIFLLNSYWNKHIIMRIFYLGFLICMAIELHYMFPKAKRPYNVCISIFAALVFPMYTMLTSYSINIILLSPPVLIMILLLFHSIFIFCKSWDTVILKLQSSIFIVIYLGLTSSYYLQIANLSLPVLHYYLLIATVFVNDGFSYLIGSSLGVKLEKHRAENPIVAVSPSKTYTGYIGGAICGLTAYGILYVIDPLLFQNSIVKMLIFGLLMNIITIVGDLFESLLKRHYQVKDSGTLMLGRGGVLDSFDSLLFAAPCYFLLYLLMFP